MKITVKNNFNLDKLVRNSKKMIEETLEEVGALAIESMQNTINSKGFGRYDELTDIRRRQRESGVYFPDQVRGSKYKTSNDIPLKQTGALYDSMEYVKGVGIEMNHYGITHNDGLPDDKFPKYVMSGQGRGKPRPFIDIGLEKTNLESVEKIFSEKIEKHMR